MTLTLEVFGTLTPGMSGADIENLVNEAAPLAARFGTPPSQHARL